MVDRKEIINLTGPVMAEQTLIIIMGVVNAVMAGHLGKEVVSAIGMVDSINNIFIAFFSALAVGGTVVVAQYTGQQNAHKANEASNHALLAGTLLSILVTILLYIFQHPILNLLLGKTEQLVLQYSSTYLGITLLTYPLIAITAVSCGVLRGAGDTKTPMQVTIFMNFLNIILSYVLIYGIHIKTSHVSFGIPAMGIRGAAYGIAIARTVGAVLIVYSLVSGSRIIKAFRSFSFNLQMFKSIFGIGIPASVESLLFNGGKLITQVFIVGMGTTAMAANYVAGSVFGLINIPGNALSVASTTLVGQCMGRRETEKAQSTLLYLVKASSILMLVICAFVFPTSKLLASIYTSNGDVIDLAATIIRTSAISMPTLWAISFILPAGLRGAGDAQYTMVVSIFGMWVFRITLGYILAVYLNMGVIGIWFGMYIDWMVRGVLFYLRLKKGKWKQKHVIQD